MLLLALLEAAFSEGAVLTRLAAQPLRKRKRGAVYQQLSGKAVLDSFTR